MNQLEPGLKSFDIPYEEEFSAVYFLTQTQPEYGKLYLTADKLYFFFDRAEESKEAAEALPPRAIDIADIKGWKKGFIKRFHIYTTDGRDILIGLWKKDALIAAIEARRK